MPGLQCFILQGRKLFLSDSSVPSEVGDKLCHTVTDAGPCISFNIKESSGPGELCLGEKEADFLLVVKAGGSGGEERGYLMNIQCHQLSLAVSITDH